MLKNANVTETMKTGEVKIAPVPPMSLQHSAVTMQIYALLEHQQFGKGGPRNKYACVANTLFCRKYVLFGPFITQILLKTNAI